MKNTRLNTRLNESIANHEKPLPEDVHQRLEMAYRRGYANGMRDTLRDLRGGVAIDECAEHYRETITPWRHECEPVPMDLPPVLQNATHAPMRGG